MVVLIHTSEYAFDAAVTMSVTTPVTMLSMKAGSF
jgi:hypothetical protein